MERLLYRVLLIFAALLFNMGVQAQVSPIQKKNVQQKWIVVSYHAAWCESCKKQAPELKRFYKKDKDQIEVYDIDLDSPKKDTLVALQKKIQLLPEPQVVPITFIYTPQGKLKATEEGLHTAEELDNIIKGQ